MYTNSRTIEHLEPEEFFKNFYKATEDNPNKLSDACGSKEDGYTITLFPLTIALWRARYGITTRMIIKHELAHVKNGDLDRKLPRPLGWLYKVLIEEPRADRAMYQ